MVQIRWKLTLIFHVAIEFLSHPRSIGLLAPRVLEVVADEEDVLQSWAATEEKRPLNLDCIAVNTSRPAAEVLDFAEHGEHEEALQRRRKRSYVAEAHEEFEGLKYESEPRVKVRQGTHESPRVFFALVSGIRLLAHR